MNIFDLKQERAKIVAQMRAIMDRNENTEMGGEDKTELTNLEKRFDALTEKITEEEKQIERERVISDNAKKEQAKKDSRMELFARALGGAAEDVAKYRNEYTLGTDATAGYLTAPVQFVDELIKGLDDILFMRRISHMTPRLGAGQSLGFPYRATEAADAEWTSEVGTITAESTLAFGRREFKPNHMAKLIKLSDTLVSHAPMAAQVVRNEMEYRIGITQEKAYMTGDGSGKPLGIFTASSSGISTARDVKTGSTSAISADCLFDAKYALKQQYIAGASWVMHRDIVKAVAKLKDSTNNYLWQPSMQIGQPDRLLGMPVYMSEYAPNTVTSGAYAAVLGNFNFYWIADADPLEIKVLKELYAETNQVGYLYNYFGDGAPVVGEAFARLKFST